jgi:flagellar P-ring protein precursor FlgI
VAQGSISVGGFSVTGEAATVSQGVPTSGRIPDGAIVEREIPFALSDLSTVNLALRNPDFTTARRIMDRINAFHGAAIALATDPATVRITVPPEYVGNVVALLTDIEQLEIEPDQPARVVIDERTGIIVMGEDVRISTVAVAQGNLTVRITETPQVSQPAPLSEGETTVVPRTEIEVDTGEERRLGVVDSGLTLQELVQSLNALGIGPRDMISILQTIKAAGALQADLEVL